MRVAFKIQEKKCYCKKQTHEYEKERFIFYETKLQSWKIYITGALEYLL